MELEDIMLNEINQTQKVLHVLSQGEAKRKTIDQKIEQ
jgi:hypothetical protein